MNELPPCVLPRRRLVRCFLAVCLVVQVVGLVFPLGTALWACLGCWTSRVEDSVAALAYVMGMGLFMVGFIYAYPVMFVLGMLAHQWRNRRKRMP